VRDKEDRPVPESRVILIPPAGSRGPFTEIRTAVTDLAGGFALSNVQPGDYRVVADVFHDVRLLEIRYWELPEWLRRFELRGQQLRVDPNGEVQIDLTPASD
jgi:hypothetical protein